MERYKVKIKNRMMFEMIGVIVFIPIAVYALIKYHNIESVMFATPINDFVGEFFNGIRAGIVMGFVIFLLRTFVKNLLIIKNEEKIKKMYIEENDERALAICEHSSRVTFNITMYVILATCVVTGLYNTAISLTLLAVWIFSILTRIITIKYYDKKL